MRSPLTLASFVCMSIAAQAGNRGYHVGSTTIFVRGNILSIDVNPNALENLNGKGGVVHKVVSIPVVGGSKCVLTKSGDAGLTLAHEGCARVKAISSNSFMIEVINTTFMDEEAKAGIKTYGSLVIHSEIHFNFSIIGDACKADTVVDFTKFSDGSVEYGRLGDTKCEVIRFR